MGGCDEGQVKITDAYNLSARHIIHAVSPIWREGTDGEEQRLALCYRNCFDLIKNYGHRTAAFPSLGTGGHGWPAKRAARIALTETVDFLKLNDVIEKVMIVCFEDESCNAYLAAAHDLDITSIS